MVLLFVGGGAVLVPQVASAQTSPAWVVVPSPNVRNAAGDPLVAVSCTSPTACTTVGTRFFSNRTHTLIQSWNGKRWRNMHSPNAKGANDLNGVSCSSPLACMAVGDVELPGTTQTLIESWNGSTWSIVPSPNVPNTVDTLSGVSCTGPSSCMAVGSDNEQTLIESWNGSTWSIVPSPNPPLAQNSLLNAVSCTSPSACTTVGLSIFPPTQTLQTLDHTLIESWNGSTWSVVPSPNVSSTENDRLVGVSCSSPTACVAVGENDSGTTVQPVIELWNGSTWSIVPSPKASATSSVLNGVWCSSSSACTSVGYDSDGNTLIESWDGSTWSIVPSPNVPNSRNALSGVSCTGATACTAAGTFGTGFLGQTLVESQLPVVK